MRFIFPKFFDEEDSEIVLLYHSIGDSALRNNRYKLNIEIELFERHLMAVSKQNKNFIITFDDGYENFYDKALPLIKKYCIKTMLFVTVGFIEYGLTSRIFLGEDYNVKPLSWSQLKEISKTGIEIGSHAINHFNLCKINPQNAHKEIVDSKKIIEDRIGSEVKYFAYPFGNRGSFDENIKKMVNAAGYKKAFTNIMGFNNNSSDLYELRRIRIYEDDGMFRFKMKIKGVCNWIDWVNRF